MNFFLSFRKSISIEIIDRDQYQRNETFLIRLGEPSLIRDHDDIDESRRCLKQCHFQTIFVFLEMTEQEKLIAELGKPRLGEKNLIRIRIRESKEFKVNKTREKKNTQPSSKFIPLRMRLTKLCTKLIPQYSWEHQHG